MRKKYHFFVVIVCFLGLNPFGQGAVDTTVPARAGNHSQNRFVPQYHIIAIDPEGNLNYPDIKQTQWVPGDFDISLKKFQPDLSTLPPGSSRKTGSDFANKTAAQYLNEMMAEIKARQQMLQNSSDSNKTLQIVIHIHGGMNLYKGAVQRATHAYWIMENHKPDGFDKNIYPIFICWNSFPVGCYFDHILYDRSGVSYRDSNLQPFTFLTAPLVLLGDFGSAIFRGPGIAMQQGFSDFRTMAPGIYPETRDYVPMFEEKKAILAGKTPSNPSRFKASIHILQGRDTLTKWDETGNFAKYIVTLPAKGITGAFINSLGPGAWAEMKRRIDLMFWRQEQTLPFYSPSQPRNIAEVRATAAEHRQEIGGVAQFLKALKEVVGSTHLKINSNNTKATISELLDEATKDKASLSVQEVDDLKQKISETLETNTVGSSNPDYSITLIGHSMGAIVINEMIEHDPEMDYRRIIYMAAACNVKDFQDAVIPYMKSNPNTKFYNLSLHPEAELRNIEALDLVPRGGLLNWIDDIFESPPDSRRRVYGKFVTAVNTSDIIPSQIRDRVYFKAFGYGNSNLDGTRFQEGFPHNHGDFNHYAGSQNSAKENPNGFWQDSFIWYDQKNPQSLTPDSLVYGNGIANPDKNPGTPAYIKSFDPEWTVLDKHLEQLAAKHSQVSSSRSKQ